MVGARLTPWTVGQIQLVTGTGSSAPLNILICTMPFMSFYVSPRWIASSTSWLAEPVNNFNTPFEKMVSMMSESDLFAFGQGELGWTVVLLSTLSRVTRASPNDKRWYGLKGIRKPSTEKLNNWSSISETDAAIPLNSKHGRQQSNKSPQLPLFGNFSIIAEKDQLLKKKHFNPNIRRFRKSFWKIL